MSEPRLDKNEYIGVNKHIKVLHRNTASFPLHAHDYFEIEVVLDGIGKSVLNGKEYQLKRGSVCMLTPADFHEVSVDTEMLQWNISFDETVLNAARLEALFTSSGMQVIGEDDLKKLDAAAELLRQESLCDGCIRPLMEYILTLLMSDIGEKSELTPVRKAILYTETHFRESPTLARTAEYACLSPVYFGNLFKKATGKTYVQYLTERKLNCAKMLLKNGFSVTEACFNSGFGSLSGFLHAFKRFAGCSPNEYKHSNSSVAKSP